MEKIACKYCKIICSSRKSLKSHHKECLELAIEVGPSFRQKISKSTRIRRGKIFGSYEWAIQQSSKFATKQQKAGFKQKTMAYLKKEIIRLELQTIDNNSANESYIKRLILCSYALLREIEVESTKNKEKKNEEIRKKSIKEMNKKLRPDSEYSQDIMSVKGKVVSGGLPSLGKRR